MQAEKRRLCVHNMLKYIYTSLADREVRVSTLHNMLCASRAVMFWVVVLSSIIKVASSVRLALQILYDQFLEQYRICLTD